VENQPENEPVIIEDNSGDNTEFSSTTDNQNTLEENDSPIIETIEEEEVTQEESPISEPTPVEEVLVVEPEVVEVTPVEP
jgi:hypothetical protein